MRVDKEQELALKLKQRFSQEKEHSIQVMKAGCTHARTHERTNEQKERTHTHAHMHAHTRARTRVHREQQHIEQIMAAVEAAVRGKKTSPEDVERYEGGKQQKHPKWGYGHYPSHGGRKLSRWQQKSGRRMKLSSDDAEHLGTCSRHICHIDHVGHVGCVGYASVSHSLWPGQWIMAHPLH